MNGFSHETDFPQALSSFQFPIAVPSDPLLGTFVTVQIPQEWIPLILGCLLQLMQETTWDVSDDNALAQAIIYANELIYMFQVRDFVIPIGGLMPFGGTTAPLGWLLCDGSAVSRITYAALFAVIGIAYGAGDGSTTFNLPDHRGRTPLGAGTGSGLSPRAVGDSFGQETHTLVTSEMPSHTHADSGHGHGVDQFVPTAAGLEPTFASLDTGLPLSSTGTGFASIQNTGGGGSHNNMQPSLVSNFIIKW